MLGSYRVLLVTGLLLFCGCELSSIRTAGNVPVALETSGSVENGKDDTTAESALKSGEWKTDEGENGIVGKVYRIPEALRNWGFRLDAGHTLEETAIQLVMPDFNISKRRFEMGFPGVPDLDEWFVIDFEATLTAPLPGNYRLVLKSDDGARLFIDGRLVLDNDGVHDYNRQAETRVELEARSYHVRLEYFQGPRVEIGLQLYWEIPGAPEANTIPASAWSRP